MADIRLEQNRGNRRHIEVRGGSARRCGVRPVA
ncbi:unnamed protein product [Medioppia subpectinata]|uniref:Uncharacterized protein n=1 Tax=Medioppia subpectinata TaxID=1979941 RepID=A0A7R9L562_9ACAR|nr:unnamed protein product [Medioppia subpectinata]CAG2114488.1 unnamed protein product [Medioppia subpectinata]